MQLLIGWFFQILVFFYQTTGNLGLAIIVLTIIIRFLLIPLTLPSLKAKSKMDDLKPELDKLKQKHGKNKQAFSQAQMALYKKYNINPLSGCLPQLVQLGLIIVLYKALMDFLGQGVVNGVEINPNFLWLNLTKPDPSYVLPVLAGVFQLILSLMIAPGGEVRDIVPNQAKAKKIKEENKKEEGVADMAASMQQQMIFLMPIMTVFIAASFPSGVAIYWVITTIFSLVQQYFVSGLGGIKIYYLRAKNLVEKLKSN